MKTLLTLTLSLLYAGHALAADVPDAGSILRDQPKAPVPRPVVPGPALIPEAPAADVQDQGPRILVKRFRIVGASLIAESELQGQLTDYLGKEYSFKQLQGIALRLIGYYAQKGYLARVFLAPQNNADGSVTFTVVEGKLGALMLAPQLDTSRIDVARAQRFLAARLNPGDPLSLPAVGEAMNVLNEQPGIQARTALKPGGNEGAVDLLVTATETPLTLWGAQLSNGGSRGTGELYGIGSVTLNNPTGRFDQASLLLSGSDGITFVSGDYSLAVGDRGLRLGINASHLDYRLTQASLRPLQGHGTADTFGASASYPLERLTESQFTLTGSLNQKRLQDHASGAETGNRSVTVGSVGVSGWRASRQLAGVSSYGASLSVVDADLAGNAAALAQDQAGRQTNGGHTKVSWYAGHMMALPGSWNLAASLRGQFADGNLDSSERFSLGGPNGVRAYPVGEAAGDEGWLLSLNLLRPINDGLSAKLFVDYGEIKLNKNTWTGWNAGNTQLKNTYALSAAGAGIDWKINKSSTLNATFAAPLGSNPGRDCNGLDADSRHLTARIWVGLVANF